MVHAMTDKPTVILAQEGEKAARYKGNFTTIEGEHKISLTILSGLESQVRIYSDDLPGLMISAATGGKLRRIYSRR